MEIFQILFYIPIYNLVIILYRLFGENLGLALIGVAFISRLITIPITNRQIKSAEKNKEFQEKYKEIKKKYAKNKEKLTEESAKLQAEYLPGQLGGCLPLIVQVIMFFNIFSVIRNIFSNGVGSFNEIAYPFVSKFPEGAEINVDFLGKLINLGKSPAEIGVSNIADFIPYAILLILVIVSQYFSNKVLTGLSSMKKVEEPKKVENKKKKDKNPDEPDFSEIMQMTSKQMMFIFPVMIGFISYNAPAGLTLYWTVQSGFVIIQRLFLDREQVKQWINSKFNKSESK